MSDALRQLGWGPKVVDNRRSRDRRRATRPSRRTASGTPLNVWLTSTCATGRFADDERAIWFTEYKDTLDYLNARLAAQGIASPETRSLFGGSLAGEQEEYAVVQRTS